jgi:uncharacterized protein involved in exopolysaccharide biosynthesis
MSTGPRDNTALAWSRRLYGRLLAAYPREHRNEYGPAMAQLFHDQCRDAWRASRGWGLTALWLRVLADLVKTSVLEHIATLKERKNMLERIGTLLRPRSAPLFVFLAVFVVVFLSVAVTSTLVTFILPESYCSTARVKLNQDVTAAAGKAGPSALSTVYDPYFIQATFELMQSELILGKVIESLDLNKQWGKKYANGATLRTSETLSLLKARMDLRPVRNTSLVEIRVYSEQPAEAAKLANAVVDAFRDYRQQQQRRLALGTAQAAEQEIKQQASRVATLQGKVAQLRKELNVPSPEPPPEVLLSKFQPYSEAKREADVAARFLDELSLKKEGARLESAMPMTLPVELLDRAVPGLRPVRPNKPLNIALGVIGGIFLATVAGAGMAGLVALMRKKARGHGLTPRAEVLPKSS